MEHADRLLLPGRCLPLRRRRSWRRGEDESDPLVTLSYLTQTVTPNILKQVDEQAAKRQSELLAQLNTAIADYKMAVEGGGASGGPVPPTPWLLSPPGRRWPWGWDAR